MDYTINCTGDACVGDHVKFRRAVFEGRYPNSRFVGTQEIQGRIIRESYGAKKQQHTFTIKMDDGTITLVKGRNLYRYGVFRKPWKDESKRELVLAEKHSRGEQARSEQERRKTRSYELY